MAEPLEKHYSADQVAEAWGVSPRTVRRMFQDVPGVLRIRAASLVKRRGAERYALRIPESLLRRAHESGSEGFTGRRAR